MFGPVRVETLVAATLNKHRVIKVEGRMNYGTVTDKTAPGSGLSGRLTSDMSMSHDHFALSRQSLKTTKEIRADRTGESSVGQVLPRQLAGDHVNALVVWHHGMGGKNAVWLKWLHLPTPICRSYVDQNKMPATTVV